MGLAVESSIQVSNVNATNAMAIDLEEVAMMVTQTQAPIVEDLVAGATDQHNVNTWFARVPQESAPTEMARTEIEKVEATAVDVQETVVPLAEALHAEAVDTKVEQGGAKRYRNGEPIDNKRNLLAHGIGFDPGVPEDSAVEVLIKHGQFVQDKAVKVKVPTSATMVQVKAALVHKIGRGSIPRVRLVEKHGNAFKEFKDAELLGGRRNLFVLGIKLNR